MLSLPSTMRVMLCTQPADMRRSFDSLAAMVEGVLRENPLAGHLFVFVNRDRDRVKVLWWDRDGYAIWYKRLEEGTFRWPASDAARLELTPAELAMILGGIDLCETRKRKRYARP
jgi:transposase